MFDIPLGDGTTVTCSELEMKDDYFKLVGVEYNDACRLVELSRRAANQAEIPNSVCMSFSYPSSNGGVAVFSFKPNKDVIQEYLESNALTGSVTDIGKDVACKANQDFLNMLFSKN